MEDLTPWSRFLCEYNVDLFLYTFWHTSHVTGWYSNEARREYPEDVDCDVERSKEPEATLGVPWLVGSEKSRELALRATKGG